MTWPRRRPTSRPASGEAGVSAGDLALQLGYNTEADHEPTVEFLQEQWRTAFDVNVELVGLEWSSYLTRLNEDPFDIFRSGLGRGLPASQQLPDRPVHLHLRQQQHEVLQ